MRDPSDCAAMRALWASVVFRGLRDAAGVDALGCNKREAIHLQVSGQRWVRSRAFEEVCALAGLDAAAVRARFRDGRVNLDAPQVLRQAQRPQHRRRVGAHE
jgi:hypothetical protein